MDDSFLFLVIPRSQKTFSQNIVTFKPFLRYCTFTFTFFYHKTIQIDKQVKHNVLTTKNVVKYFAHHTVRSTTQTRSFYPFGVIFHD